MPKVDEVDDLVGAERFAVGLDGAGAEQRAHHLGYVEKQQRVVVHRLLWAVARDQPGIALTRVLARQPAVEDLVGRKCREQPAPYLAGDELGRLQLCRPRRWTAVPQ